MLVGQLSGAGRAAGAVADRIGLASSEWPAGLYLLQVDFAGSLTSDWLGLLIEASPNS